MSLTKISLLSLVLFPALAQAASPTYSTNFSGFTPGDVQGQQGFAYPSNSPTVGNIVATPGGAPPGAGSQSLQFQETSNPALFGVANGVNGPRVSPAGETGTSTGDGMAATSNQFRASFLYRTPDQLVASSTGAALIAFNPASSINSTTADRYAFFGLVNSADGKSYQFVISPLTGNDIVALDNVQPDTFYQISELLTFVDGTNPDGSPNDVFSVTVSNPNGTQLGSATGPDWEGTDGYRDPTFAGIQGPLAVDTLDFLNRFGPANQVEGLITNLSYSTAAIGVPEPASVLMLGVGLAAIAGARFRRRV